MVFFLKIVYEMLRTAVLCVKKERTLVSVSVVLLYSISSLCLLIYTTRCTYACTVPYSTVPHGMLAVWIKTNLISF